MLQLFAKTDTMCVIKGTMMDVYCLQSDLKQGDYNTFKNSFFFVLKTVGIKYTTWILQNCTSTTNDKINFSQNIM